MKIGCPGLDEQTGQVLSPAGKDALRHACEISGPFSEMLNSLADGRSDMKSEPSSLDREGLKTFAEMLSIRMGYRVLSSLGSLGGEPEDEFADPVLLLSPFPSLPLKANGKIPPDTGISYPRPGIRANRIGDERLASIISRASAACGVDRGLITEVIRAESGFDASAVSSKGAMGLMQLMPETARELGVNNPYDPEENVMAGTRYLRSLLDRYNGSVPLALAAYNWGMGNLERSSRGLPDETRDYVAKIMRGFGRDRA